MPPGVPYIIGNEAAERFSYYGMQSVLIVFMTHYLVNELRRASLTMSSNGGMHTKFRLVLSAVYFLPILGAVIAEGFLGNTGLFLAVDRLLPR